MPGPATFDPDHPTAHDVHRNQELVELPYKEIRGPQDRVGRLTDVGYDSLFESKPGGDQRVE